MLKADPKPVTREKFVRYSQNWQKMAELEPRTTFNPWTMDTPSEPPTTSLPAQVAYKVIEANWPDTAPDMHRRLLEAYFTHNRTISDWEVLADISAEAGLDREAFLTMAGEQRGHLAQVVIDEHNSAIDQGVTAVPTVVINGVLPVPGAQDAESYIAWIERLLERQRAEG